MIYLKILLGQEFSGFFRGVNRFGVGYPAFRDKVVFSIPKWRRFDSIINRPEEGSNVGILRLPATVSMVIYERARSRMNVEVIVYVFKCSG